MFDQIFLAINSWMAGGLAIAVVGCFSWGVVSVLFSPCHMASIPLIIGYVGGQRSILEGKHAVPYAVLFTLGLFITIAIVGIICLLLGRMLGDVGPYWTLLLGGILIWVAVDMLGIAKCRMPNILGKLQLHGLAGAFILGLAYGVLSGSCTFGFIAPILAIITVQKKIVTGLLLLTFFAIGHCTPIVIAGSSAATVKRMLANSSFQKKGVWFRKGSGVVIGILGLYFIVRPWLPWVS
ncbi:cytochrome C biogenesis protein CcdA [Desulfomarina profundi]|uniref:Cytochrome C biogenesis protein CcdA n=1 Tax=Desulfomarina profundi TaxID=2772557 RepID=A0A8D5JPL7_9BACT|nr:cytochrome c biogenesis protein CcdA [Desulfomarina profundi]BCL61400.1 cytochrome C biogenesis protein CcdA [Desulfomarina profundi]